MDVLLFQAALLRRNGQRDQPARGLAAGISKRQPATCELLKFCSDTQILRRPYATLAPKLTMRLRLRSLLKSERNDSRPR
jgi:hypothetical protein